MRFDPKFWILSIYKRKKLLVLIIDETIMYPNIEIIPYLQRVGNDMIMWHVWLSNSNTLHSTFQLV